MSRQFQAVFHLNVTCTWTLVFNYLNYTSVGCVYFEVSIFLCLLVWQGVCTSGKNAEQLKIAAGRCQVTSDYSEAFYLLFRCINWQLTQRTVCTYEHCVRPSCQCLEHLHTLTSTVTLNCSCRCLTMWRFEFCDWIVNDSLNPSAAVGSYTGNVVGSFTSKEETC